MRRRGHVLGTVGGPCEARQTDEGTTIASVRVATEEYHDDDTVWVEVTAFGHRADYLADYAERGDTLYANGRYQLDEWEQGASLELVASDLELIGGSS